MKKTKIVCTIGPACANEPALVAMVKAGMNVARLNFSHGDYENHAFLIKHLRAVAEKLNVPLAIIQDLQGPKIRVSAMKEPLDVQIGTKVVIGKDFSLDFDISKSVKSGQMILIEDGLIELEIDEVKGKLIFCTALTRGRILSHKGVNLPRTKVKFPILTEKDVKDLKFGLSQNVDYVALSFVRNKRDITHLKSLIKKHTPKGEVSPKVIAKIEKPEAVADFDKILAETDAVMIARGDLGVEISDSIVPVVQKELIRKCLNSAKPVIVATQMLDSMIRNPRPTRAEVSDVANAVIDQADAVMLSGETAFGKYPVEAVVQMKKIIEATEKSAFLPEHKHLMKNIVGRTEAITEGVYDLAAHTNAKVIVGATTTGFTARQVAHKRPYHTRLVMLTPNEKVKNQLALVWGVESFLVPLVKNFEELMQEMINFIRFHKIVKKGEKVVIVTGEPLSQKENLNVVEVRSV